MFITSAILCCLGSVIWMRIKAHVLDTQKDIYLQKDSVYTMSNCISFRTTHTLKMNFKHAYFSMTMKLFTWHYFCIWLVNKIKIFWLSIAIKWKLLLSETKLTVSDLELWGALGKWDNFEWIQIHSLQSLFGGKKVCNAFVRLPSYLSCLARFALISVWCLKQTPGQVHIFYSYFFSLGVFLLSFSLKLIHSWVFSPNIGIFCVLFSSR